mmetsp:Transcript_91086/g.174661  ORF Transcript_91086/g.174661 Transcript_91086/m.174661 type:complete len:265 (+) Transcript_91086:720-1514(+)
MRRVASSSLRRLSKRRSRSRSSRRRRHRHPPRSRSSSFRGMPQTWRPLQSKRSPCQSQACARSRTSQRPQYRQPTFQSQEHQLVLSSARSCSSCPGGAGNRRRLLPSPKTRHHRQMRAVRGFGDQLPRPLIGEDGLPIAAVPLRPCMKRHQLRRPLSHRSSSRRLRLTLLLRAQGAAPRRLRRAEAAASRQLRVPGRRSPGRSCSSEDHCLRIPVLQEDRTSGIQRMTWFSSRAIRRRGPRMISLQRKEPPPVLVCIPLQTLHL